MEVAFTLVDFFNIWRFMTFGSSISENQNFKFHFEFQFMKRFHYWKWCDFTVWFLFIVFCLFLYILCASRWIQPFYLHVSNTLEAKALTFNSPMEKWFWFERLNTSDTEDWQMWGIWPIKVWSVIDNYFTHSAICAEWHPTGPRSHPADHSPAEICWSARNVDWSWICQSDGWGGAYIYCR